MTSKAKIKAIIDADNETDIRKKNTSLLTVKNKTDFDSAWKEVIERLFEPFTGFFFPVIHKDIDFSKGGRRPQPIRVS